MTSPTAKSAPTSLQALDNRDLPVLAALASLEERVSVLLERVSSIEQVVRREQAPTATMHHLYALEEATAVRIRSMSDLMTLMLGRVGDHLAKLGDDEATMSPGDIMAMVERMTKPRKPKAP